MKTKECKKERKRKPNLPFTTFNFISSFFFSSFHFLYYLLFFSFLNLKVPLSPHVHTNTFSLLSLTHILVSFSHIYFTQKKQPFTTYYLVINFLSLYLKNFAKSTKPQNNRNDILNKTQNSPPLLFYPLYQQ